MDWQDKWASLSLSEDRTNPRELHGEVDIGKADRPAAEYIRMNSDFERACAFSAQSAEGSKA